MCWVDYLFCYLFVCIMSRLRYVSMNMNVSVCMWWGQKWVLSIGWPLLILSLSLSKFGLTDAFPLLDWKLVSSSSLTLLALALPSQGLRFQGCPGQLACYTGAKIHNVQQALWNTDPSLSSLLLFLSLFFWDVVTWCCPGLASNSWAQGTLLWLPSIWTTGSGHTWLALCDLILS